MSALKRKVVNIKENTDLKESTLFINTPSNDPCLPLVELKNVCKSYGEGKTKTSILKNINLTVKEGEFIAIVGFSGSGKTTLISTIAGLIQADSGDVLKQGAPITGPGRIGGSCFKTIL